MSEIRESDSEGVYIVKSQSHDGVEYEVDTSRWRCTCTIAWIGKPTGEPCKHQAAVAKKYNLSSINYIPVQREDMHMQFWWWELKMLVINHSMVV